MKRAAAWDESLYVDFRKAYRSGGLAAAYRAHPEISKGVIYKRLVKAGIHISLPIELSAAAPWTSGEDSKMHRYYPDLGAAGLFESRRLPGRSRLSIKKRATVLGLTAPGHELAEGWSKEDTEAAVAFVKREAKGKARDWDALRTAFPAFTDKAISSKLYAIKTGGGQSKKRSAPRAWTAGEEAILREHYGEMPAAELSELIGRSPPAITNRAYDLGLTAPHRK